MELDRRVYLAPWSRVERPGLYEAIDWCGGWSGIGSGTRVLIKPNLTYPFYQPGVTTPPDTIRALTELLLDHGAQVTICEGGPTSTLYSAMESFDAHGILALRDEYGVRVVDLCSEPLLRRKMHLRPRGVWLAPMERLGDQSSGASSPQPEVDWTAYESSLPLGA